jgi:bifunctional UDP-N-acetylglucosamine pyrophosphorylase/glucosamine-1-phosphate N-acetyltransferase
LAETVAIILAAGVSSRMNTDIPKVLHQVCGRPMLEYVLDAVRQAGAKRIYVVVGFGGRQVKEKFGTNSDIIWVNQQQQKGTAHAVLCCKKYLGDFDGRTLVLCGDGPLIRPQTLKTLIEIYRAENPALVLATAILDDPAGYGRVIRDKSGNITGIVEHNDCTDEQLKIREINPSYYLFNNKILFEALKKVRPDNVKKEYYLTDALSIIIAAGHKVTAIPAVRPEGAMSINNRDQLNKVNTIMRQRLERKLVKQPKNGIVTTLPKQPDKSGRKGR